MNPALLILGIAVFAVGMMSRIDPTFPQISTELGTSLQTTATLASAFGFAYAFIQPAMGIMADRYGQTKVILGCLTVLGLATLACAFATSFESLMICRVVAGAAAGGIPPASLSLASDLSKPSERQIAISRIIAGATTGYVIGAVFSGALSDLLGWRSMFGASAVLIAIGIVAFVRGLKHFGAASHRDRGSLMNLFTSYKKILLHKTALTCFIGVFVEGACHMSRISSRSREKPVYPLRE